MSVKSLSRPLTRQLVVYFLTGIFVNGMGFFLFFLLVNFGINSKLSMSVLYVVGVFGSYLGNKNIGFKSKEGHLTGFIKFLFVYCVGYCLNLFAHIHFVDSLDYSPYLVQGIMIVIVSVFIFISFKFFVFRHVNS